MIPNSVFESCVHNLGFYRVKLRVPLRVALRSVALRFVLRCFALRVPLRVALRSEQCLRQSGGTRARLERPKRARAHHPRRSKMSPGRARRSPRRRQEARNEPQEVAGDPT